MSRRLELFVGQPFGRVTVVAQAGRRARTRTGRYQSVWACRCACGAPCHLTTTALRNWKLPSCGCASRRERHGRTASRRRGHWPEYRIWKQIRQACTNPRDLRWASCGARGIRVYPPWAVSFVTFIRDVGRRPTRAHRLRRIDPNGDFHPGNVIWAVSGTPHRADLRTLVRMGGEVRSVAEWGDLLGIPRRTLRRRLDSWALGDVLRNGVRKLSTADVQEIFLRHWRGERGADLAAEYAVVPNHVYKIAAGAAWREKTKNLKKDIDTREGLSYNAPRPPATGPEVRGALAERSEEPDGARGGRDHSGASDHGKFEFCPSPALPVRT